MPKFQLDGKHATFDLFGDPFVKGIWEQRYKAEGERNIADTFLRVVHGVYAKDEDPDARTQAFEALRLGLFIPAGRILSSAGLPNTKSTLQNCYVSCTIEDSIEGIHKAYSEAMITLGRYGGIGMDFSPIRPKGAKVGVQGLTSPGVVHWMQMWHEGADRVKQAGHRRGAMMGTLRDSHPDILDFIEAKHTKGALTNFNVSILVSDAFMQAVRDDADWYLGHPKPSTDPTPIRGMIAIGGEQCWVYKIIKARELWEKIMRSTYEYSEPGVIFIDKINNANNLWYCEDIRCTNPCGEQPLPPYGACNLGHINLARMVMDPFTSEAKIDWELLRSTVRVAVRFLDNVIDVSNFPLDEQAIEQQQKRRIGLGVTGLADMLIQLGLSYGQLEARNKVSSIMEGIARTAYHTSYLLATKHGAFPLYDNIRHGKKGLAARMNQLGAWHRDCGTRNSLLLTVAPTGTTSIVFGNVSSGIEPNFAFRTNRKVWVANNEFETHTNESFISRFATHCGLEIASLDAAITASMLHPDDHIKMQAVVQEWIDASVTKTVNCPADIGFEHFKAIYEDAYDSGCKGCTAYRPSDVRGSVIEDVDNAKALTGEPMPVQAEVNTVELQPTHIDNIILTGHLKPQPLKRPDLLVGCTYKLKWPHFNDNIFLTINESDGRPYEVFIASMDLRNIEWIVLACVQLSLSLRRGENATELAALFKKIQGASEGSFVAGKYYSSLVAYIGDILEQHFQKYELVGNKMSDAGAGIGLGDKVVHGSETMRVTYKKCPKCSAPLIMSEGCENCPSCGHSKCS